MCWMCDHPDSSFDEYVEEVVRPTVALYGFAVQATERHGVPLAYTVGLAEQGGPELCITGKPPDAAHDLLRAAVGREAPARPGRCDLLVGPALWAFPVIRPEALAVAWALFPGLSALQLVWADSFGRWPWEVHRSGQRLLCDVRARRAA
jgi:hypothetical protein